MLNYKSNNLLALTRKGDQFYQLLRSWHEASKDAGSSADRAAYSLKRLSHLMSSAYLDRIELLPSYRSTSCHTALLLSHEHSDSTWKEAWIQLTDLSIEACPGAIYSARVLAIVKGTVTAAATALAIPPQKNASVPVSSVLPSPI